jgi:hypothetical protein
MTGPELNSSAVAVAGPDTGAGAGAGDDDVSSALYLGNASQLRVLK